MALTNFDNWRDNLNEGLEPAPVATGMNPADTMRALKKGVMGLDQTLLKKAVPFINSMAGMDQTAKVKLIAHVMQAAGLTPNDFSQIRTKM